MLGLPSSMSRGGSTGTAGEWNTEPCPMGKSVTREHRLLYLQQFSGIFLYNLKHSLYLFIEE